MPKGSLENNRVQTRMELLREQIRLLEVGVAGLHADNVLDLLRWRSEAEVTVAEAEALGRDLRAERTRLATIDNMLDRHATRVVTLAARRGGLGSAREKLAPPREHWWWYLDETVADRLRHSVVRAGAVIIGVVLVLLLGNYLLNTFFGMSPEEREAYGHTTMAEQMMYVGEYEDAIERYEQAIEIVPDLPEAWVALATLYELQGRDGDYRAALARAETLVEDPLRLTLLLARQYETVQLLDVALAYAEQALEIDPDSAEAHLIRGGIYDNLGDREQALADFEHASELARERGEDALYVLARTRMGMLMQQGDLALPGGTAP